MIKIKKFLSFFFIVVLSAPAGGILGGFLGLITTTFIPQCCSDHGCRNCFEFKGMIGYEATGYLGFWAGFILLPIICFVMILYRKK